MFCLFYHLGWYPVAKCHLTNRGDNLDSFFSRFYLSPTEGGLLWWGTVVSKGRYRTGARSH